MTDLMQITTTTAKTEAAAGTVLPVPASEGD